MHFLTEIFISNTFTKSQVSHRLALLKHFLEYSFFSSQENITLKRIEDYLEEKKEPKEVIVSFLQWGEDFYGNFNDSNLYNLISQIEEEIKKFPVIYLYVPVNLNSGNVERIGKWLRQNVEKNILMEIKIDFMTAGGCGFVWNNTYYDFSFSYFLDKKKEDFIEVLNKNVKK